jgi:signal transduction histidine kinase
MRSRGLLTRVGAVAGWLLVPCALVTVVLVDQQLSRVGRGDLTVLRADATLLPAGMISSATVGAALALRRPRHRVGWLFLALGDLLALDGIASAYAAYGAVARPGALPAATVVATFADTGFVTWLTVLALILHLTPTGVALSRGWRAVAAATVACGTAWFAAGLVRPGHLNPPLQGVSNPMGVQPLAGTLVAVSRVLGYATALGVIVAAVSLLVRFRRAEGLERQRLLWMAVAAVPVPVFVGAAFASSRLGNDVGVALASGGLVIVLPVAAGLSVARYHLYDVDRILSRAVSYLLLSGLLAGSYLAAVFIVGQTFGGLTGRSGAADVASTLVAVTVAAPSYRHIQNVVDRRFNRRRFDALRLVREFVRNPTPGLGVQAVLRTSLGDAQITIAYWIGSRRQWVTSDGHAAPIGPDDVLVRRQGRPVASIGFDSAATERWLVEAAAIEATTELENAGLRADLAQRLVEVQESRARLTAAQVTERRKIERDLHDGAQQRLLALALQLRAAHDRAGPQQLRHAVENGIQQLQAAIVELRELANGVHPAALHTGGLIAALDDLAARTPVPIALCVSEERFPPAVEATAWFIACEAVTNAVKHAAPTMISITVFYEPTRLVVTIDDDGCGGADPDGRGLRGITDRAESIGGTLTVSSNDRGTSIRTELPCVS